MASDRELQLAAELGAIVSRDSLPGMGLIDVMHLGYVAEVLVLEDGFWCVYTPMQPGWQERRARVQAEIADGTRCPHGCLDPWVECTVCSRAMDDGWAASHMCHHGSLEICEKCNG